MSSRDDDEPKGIVQLSDNHIKSNYDNGKVETFDAMALNSELVRGIFAFGLETPTTIQQYAIPPMVQGKSLALQAPSGGKSIAFAISSLQRVDTRSKAVQVLVLQKSREDAVGVQKWLEHLGQYMEDISSMAAFGGTQFNVDAEHLKNDKPQVVIGVPGRTSDLISRGVLDLQHLKLCVVDDIDELMARGFLASLQQILDGLPSDTQLVFGSSESSDEFKSAVDKYIPDQISISVEAQESEQ